VGKVQDVYAKLPGLYWDLEQYEINFFPSEVPTMWTGNQKRRPGAPSRSANIPNWESKWAEERVFLNNNNQSKKNNPPNHVLLLFATSP